MFPRFRRILWILPLAVIGCQDGEAPADTPSISGETDEELLVRARELHDRVITIDTHADIPFNFGTDEMNPGERGNRQVDLPKMREGGLDAAFFIVYVGQTERTPENYQAAYDGAMSKFTGIRRMALETHTDEVGLALSPADVLEISASGRLVALIGVENGYSIGTDISRVEEFYNLGARYLGLVHNGHNDLADSAQPRLQLDVQSEHDGVSELGRQAIAEMNRLGIMVDVSHASKKSMLDAAELSRAPIIASHSSARTLAGHVRNMDDEQLMALRDNGGVIHTVALGSYVVDTPPDKTAAIQALRDEFGIAGGRGGGSQSLSDEDRAAYDSRMEEIEEQWPSANVASFVDHIDYMVDLIGVDHVGISSDFDGGGGITGWDDASETFNVTLEMVRRGYTDEEIEKIWSGNLLRVWTAVDSVAAEIQGGDTAGNGMD